MIKWLVRGWIRDQFCRFNTKEILILIVSQAKETWYEDNDTTIRMHIIEDLDYALNKLKYKG